MSAENGFLWIHLQNGAGCVYVLCAVAAALAASGNRRGGLCAPPSNDYGMRFREHIHTLHTLCSVPHSHTRFWSLPSIVKSRTPLLVTHAETVKGARGRRRRPPAAAREGHYLRGAGQGRPAEVSPDGRAPERRARREPGEGAWLEHPLAGRGAVRLSVCL